MSKNSNGEQIIYLANNNWDEDTLNFKNQPQQISQVATTNFRRAEEVMAIDVTSNVVQALGGYISFEVSSSANNELALYSKEGSLANKRPVLEITVQTDALLISPTPTLTPTLTPTPTPTTTPTPIITTKTKVLCDGKSFSNWGSTSPITIGDNPDDTNPDILKVIRNCNFVNLTGVAVTKAAIDIKRGDNILIENSRFENIRTLIPDDGILAIATPGQGSINNIVIRGNFFKDIGADGIQPGPGGPNIRNMRIENNEFIGSEAVGENAVDIKGVYGPIIVTGNKIHGFRPCESSKTNPPGTQDCSGSTGPGIVVHVGSANSPPQDIYIEGNDIYDNTYGINVSGGNNIVVKNNYIYNNIKAGINRSGGSVTLSGNTYSGNGTNCSGISPCQ